MNLPFCRIKTDIFLSATAKLLLGRIFLLYYFVYFLKSQTFQLHLLSHLWNFHCFVTNCDKKQIRYFISLFPAFCLSFSVFVLDKECLIHTFINSMFLREKKKKKERSYRRRHCCDVLNCITSIFICLLMDICRPLLFTFFFFRYENKIIQICHYN